MLSLLIAMCVGAVHKLFKTSNISQRPNYCLDDSPKGLESFINLLCLHAAALLQTWLCTVVSRAPAKQQFWHLGRSNKMTAVNM